MKIKKQLEEKENIACNWKDSCLENAGKIEILETQQKEFYKYLEDEIKFIENKVFSFPCLSNERNYLICIENKLIKVLQKYEEIVNGTE